MGPASTAEVMMNALVKVAQDKVDAGDNAGAIKTLDMIVDSIVNNEAHVQKTFGQNLVYLYCWRAKLHCEIDTPGVQAAPDNTTTPVDDAASDDDAVLVDHMELARQNVRQAEAALETHFPGLDVAQKETARASINAVISPDEKQRADGLAAVRQMKTAVSLSGGTAAHSAGGRQAQDGEAGISLGVHAMVFVVGLIAWGLVIGLFYATFATSSSSEVSWVLMIPALILAYIAVDLATKGWDWLADRGVYGWRFKVMLIVILLLTVIGALPVIYWTGKGAVRWYYQRR